MQIPNLNDIAPYIPDMILILISGLACLYCAMLSRRLRKLNNLKTGVGASILSLTQAIEDTHVATQEAQNSTLQTVETLRHLLEKCENAGPKVEALVTELEQASDRAKAQCGQLDTLIDTQLSDAVERAQATASGLLKVASDLNDYKKKLHPPSKPIEYWSQDTLINLSDVKRSAS